MKPAEITRRAKSNLAFAFMCVPQDRRPDLNVFYAFCRVVDDIADDTSRPPEEKRAALQNWMQAVEKDDHPKDSLEAQVVAMRKRHSIDPSLLQQIIRG